MTAKRIVITSLKWLGRIVLSVLLLLVLILVLLQTDFGKNIVRKQTVRYLSKKTGTRVEISGLNVDWLSHIELIGVYIEDLSKRPLLRLNSLDLSYDLSGILQSKLDLPKIKVEGLDLQLHRAAKDTNFNFQFIIDAFAGNTDVEKKSDPTNFSLKLGDLSLRNISFSMNDQYGGQQMRIQLPRLTSVVASTDITNLKFRISQLMIDSLNVGMQTFAAAAAGPKSATTGADNNTGFVIDVDTASITGPNIIIQDEVAKFGLNTKATFLNLSAIHFDLAKMEAGAELIHLRENNTSVSYSSANAPGQTNPEDTGSDSASASLKFSVQQLLVDQTDVAIDDVNALQKPATQIDFGHLKLSEINIDARQIAGNNDLYSADIRMMNASEKSGFTLEQLIAKGYYSDTAVALSGLTLKTSQNLLMGDFDLSYPSLAQITKQPAATFINANIAKAELKLDELLYFEPALKKNKSFAPLLGKRFFASTQVRGPLNKLFIPSFRLRESNTELQASATVSNLPDIDRMAINLNLKQLSGNRKDLLALLPKGTIPDSLLHYIPENFAVAGTYNGTLSSFSTNLQLKTSEGNATIKGTAKNITDKKAAQYDLALNTTALKLGHLLQDTTLGNVTASIALKGKGLDPAIANANYKINVSEAFYKGYTYHDVRANGSIANKTIDAEILSNDPNAKLDGSVHFNLDPEKGGIRTETHLQKIDLQKLGFSKDSLIIAGNISADIPEFDTARLSGDVFVTNMAVYKGSKMISLDSIAINAHHVNDSQYIRLTSPFADAELNGHYTLQSIPAAATTIANRYIYANSSDTLFTKSLKATLKASIHLPDSMLALVPGLKKLAPLDIESAIDTDSSKILLATIIPEIEYKDYKIDTAVLFAADQPGPLASKGLRVYSGISRFTTPSFYLESSGFASYISKGVFKTLISLDDGEGQPRYIIPFEYHNDPQRPYVQFKDSVMLNKRQWKANDENILYTDTKALQGSNLTLSNGKESLSLKAESQLPDGLPLSLTLHDFRLKNLTEIFMSDTAIAEGFANGTVAVTSFEPFIFTSNLHIDSLALKGIKAGNLYAVVAMQNDANLGVDVNLLGLNNDLKLEGSYSPDDQEADLKLDMKKFDLANLGPFTVNYLDKLSGRLKGQMQLVGPLNQANLTGWMATDSAQTIYKDFGTYISLPADTITISDHTIRLKDFRVYDSSGRFGSLNGNIMLMPGQDMQISLDFLTDDIQLVGYKMYQQQYVYGPSRIKARMNFKGTSALLQVDGSVNVKDSSYLSYVYNSEQNVQQGDGLIEFFDPNNPIDTGASTKPAAQKSTMQLGLNIYVTATPSSTVSIVLDESTGDRLQINGKAELNFGMSPGGQLSLNGNYLLESGLYDLTIAQVIKKQFTIQKGSTISWSGDPIKGIMDITALYKTKTSAGELVTDIQAVPGINKQQLNFEVYLYLTKELLKPEINFKIDMPTKDQQAFNGIIYTRLKQVNYIPSELNKQVMGLLAINHFIADNPFSSLTSGGKSLETTAISTAGRLLTQELTNLAAKMVKGVDIDFALDVNEDYTSGQGQRNTDLKVGVSKSLARNRLKIYVGSSFALESQNQNVDALEGLAGDITLEYLLNSSGKYRLKGFRVNQNDLTFNGTIVKTGATFSMVLEFNKFKNAFGRKKKKKK